MVELTQDLWLSQWAFTAKTGLFQDILLTQLGVRFKKIRLRKVLVRMEAEVVKN